MAITLHHIARAFAAAAHRNRQAERIAALRITHGEHRLSEDEASEIIARHDAAAEAEQAAAKGREELATAITGNANDGGLL